MKMTKFNFSPTEENEFFKIVEFRERVSDHLVSQLREMLEEGRVHTEAVVDEIRYLEGLRDRTRTKKAKKFSGGKLKGFWHSHFFNGDVSEQAKNYMKLLDKEGAFEKIYRDILAKTNDPMELSRLLAERIVAQQYQDINSAKSWTGNWIIYAKHNDKNYYLMVASHSSPGDDTDPLYSEMKSKCESQFPFLFSNENS
ncbi:hypothetical protein BIW53_19740 [Pseudoalteromonas byunsanensis]|uniref:Uncharacterized protein n=2 Tax=Pseudoalteromonas byunsanensis TaxID=327939 RepID=A0A1S1N5P0_9GAMM|nr:hypothetical protein BIW53_19740 [Pseudoalteromonas byunsanensis]